MRHALSLIAAIACLFGGSPYLSAAEPAATERGQKMLDGYLRRQTQRIADACLADVKSREDWEKKRPELRRQFLEMVGLWPLPPRTDLKATITGKVDTEKFTIEKLHFQSMPGLYVTANLYIPKQAQFPAPTVLYVCGHGQTIVDKVPYGTKVTYQHHPAWLAEHGYVCLIIDTLQLGEIEGIHHGTAPRMKNNMWWWHTLGYTPAGVECWNAMRALDYLETRPEVDAKRFGVTGRSGGGAYSWWLAAADDRPQCIIPVAGIADLWAHVVEGVAPRFKQGVIAGHCDCMYMTNTYHWDFPMVAALCAPRPLLLGNSDVDDIFPVPGYRRLADKVKKIYQLYGAEEKFALLETTGPHKDTRDLRLGAFRWLNRWLKNDTGEVTERDYVKLEPQQLKVFDRLPADAINAKIQETFVPAARLELPTSRQAAEEWMKTKSPELQQTLRDRVFGAWPGRAPALDRVPIEEVEREGLRIRAFEFKSEEGVEPRLMIVTAADVKKPRRLVVNVVDEDGWQRSFQPSVQMPLKGDAADRERLRKHLLQERSAQVTFAPRGIGPTRWSDAGTPEDAHIRRRFVLLGQTLDGQRVWDVRRAVQALIARPEYRDLPLTLQGQGQMAGIALYAAIFEPAVSELDLWDLPASHREGPFLLNVRLFLDTPQALALAFPRPIHLHAKDIDAAKNWEWTQRLQSMLGKNYLKIH